MNYTQHTHDGKTVKQRSVWTKNRRTGKAFRPDGDYGYVSDRICENLPRRFKRDEEWEWWERQKESEAMLKQGGKSKQLIDFYGSDIYFYTLSVKELGGESWLEDFRRYDDSALIEAWQRSLDKAFAGWPYAWCLHVGRCGRVQAHAISGKKDSIPFLSHDPERKKRIDNSFKDHRKAFAYLCSKQYPTYEQVASFKKAVKKGGGELHLPKHKGYRNFEPVKVGKKEIENVVTDGTYKNNPLVITEIERDYAEQHKLG